MSLSRRALLTGAAAGGTVLAAAGAAAAIAARGDAPAVAAVGVGVEEFHGVHQAGIATVPQAHGAFLGLDLRPGTDRDALGRLLRLLSDDAARLTRGGPALADTEPELAALPARLTVTFGFGPGVFAVGGLEQHRPAGFAALPAFGIDRLEDRWSGGDLLVQVCADDLMVVGHALRMLVKDARSFASVRWVQRGFRRAAGVHAPGVTHRNVLGHLDGTANPAPGGEVFDRTVWNTDGPAWLRGGTTLVLRRIRADLDSWDAVDVTAREFAVGRRVDSGAPLTGRREHDEPDLGAVDGLRLPVISEFAHIRRARAEPGGGIYRRPYNYDDAVDGSGRPDTGLLFASWQADIARQYLPIQQRLADSDLLNKWTTPVGSAVFAVPPGCGPGGWIGEGLLGA